MYSCGNSALTLGYQLTRVCSEFGEIKVVKQRCNGRLHREWGHAGANAPEQVRRQSPRVEFPKRSVQHPPWRGYRAARGLVCFRASLCRRGSVVSHRPDRISHWLTIAQPERWTMHRTDHRNFACLLSEHPLSGAGSKQTEVYVFQSPCECA